MLDSLVLEVVQTEVEELIFAGEEPWEKDDS